ncbi:hypothetical protein M3J09_008823 [Ascochyta lentis]
MASPTCNDAGEAAEQFLESNHISSRSSSEDDYSSVPPSPEIGMAREGEGNFTGADLSLDDEDVVGHSLPGTPGPDDDATFSTSTEGQCAEQPRTRQTQLSPRKGAQRASPESADAQIMIPIPTCPPPRRSARAKSTLMYDQKYHPMDDFIRPTQAAKRRSLHGEEITLCDNSGASSEQSGSNVGSADSDEDSDDEDSQPPTRGRKRKRARSRTPEPTRRSSRRRVKPKMSYNMQIHPQDSDLERVYACDGSKSSPLPKKRERSGTDGPSRKDGPFEDYEETCYTLPTDALKEDTTSALSPELSSQTVITGNSSPVLKTKLCDAYPNLRPDLAYLTGSQNVWPDAKGLPFSIFTERIEDQLNAEAEAASPFHYNDDDKENDVTNPELIPRPNPLDGISIIPASHYRQPPGLYTLPRHVPMVSNAFYPQPRFEASPYGLGWSDGAQDLNDSVVFADRRPPEWKRDCRELFCSKKYWRA